MSTDHQISTAQAFGKTYWYMHCIFDKSAVRLLLKLVLHICYNFFSWSPGSKKRINLYKIPVSLFSYRTNNILWLRVQNAVSGIKYWQIYFPDSNCSYVSIPDYTEATHGCK